MALFLRSIRLMKNQSMNDTAQPVLQPDPDEWKTGDEPMTDAQRSYLDTLCRETGETFDEALSKADASKRIDELRERSRGSLRSKSHGRPGAYGARTATKSTPQKRSSRREPIDTGDESGS